MNWYAMEEDEELGATCEAEWAVWGMYCWDSWDDMCDSVVSNW